MGKDAEKLAQACEACRKVDLMKNRFQEEQTPRDLVHELYKAAVEKKQADDECTQPADQFSAMFIEWSQESEQKMNAIRSQLQQQTNR
jgi:hypothetical protein